MDGRELQPNVGGETKAIMEDGRLARLGRRGNVALLPAGNNPFEIPPTPWLVAPSGGQASINATVRHWETYVAGATLRLEGTTCHDHGGGSVQSHRRKDTIVPSFVGHLALPY